MRKIAGVFEGYLKVDGSEDLSELTEVTGGLDVCEGATIMALSLVEVGELYVREGVMLMAPVLTMVVGWLEVREGATLTAPALGKVGWLEVCEGATLEAPVLVG